MIPIVRFIVKRSLYVLFLFSCSKWPSNFISSLKRNDYSYDERAGAQPITVSTIYFFSDRFHDDTAWSMWEANSINGVV